MAGQKFKLTRDVLWWTTFNAHPISLTLKEGEICEYFAHSNTYTFEPRLSLEGADVSPWYPASVVEAWGFWFEPVE